MASWLRRIDWMLFERHGTTRFRRLFSLALSGMSSVLDVGCGTESPIGRLDPRPHAVGLDSHRPSLNESLAKGLHDAGVVGDALDIVDLFGRDSFDAVIAMDVIEHLPKEAGWRLLEQMTQVARERVVIFTPNGFLPQVRDEVNVNPAQEHLSGWTVSDLDSHGFEVWGINGWKHLRGIGLLPTIKPTPLGLRLSLASQPLIERRPEHAFQLLAVKCLR